MVPMIAPCPRPLGIHALGIASAVLTRLGFHLADPFDGRLAFDLLASNDPGLRLWYKIQVKQSSKTGWVSLRRGDKRRGCRRYIAGDFDYLVAVDDECGTFLVPFAAIQHCRSRVCLRGATYARYRVAGPLGRVIGPMTPEAAARPLRLEQLHLFPTAEHRRAAA